MKESDKRTSNTERQLSFAEKKRLFSLAAQALVSKLLNGKVEILPDDIQLESDGIENHPRQGLEVPRERQHRPDHAEPRLLPAGRRPPP